MNRLTTEYTGTTEPTKGVETIAIEGTTNDRNFIEDPDEDHGIANE